MRWMVVKGGQLLSLAFKAPKLVRGPLTRLAFAYLRKTECPRGRHFAGWNYCGYGCGAQLARDAWREWTVMLADGSVLRVKATTEAHARGMVVYGETAPGKLDLKAVQDERVRVHEDNIVSCTPGQITDAPTKDVGQSSPNPTS